MVSTPEVFTDNSPISNMKPTPVKKPSDRKSLCMFTNILDVDKKLLTVELELLNINARRLNMEILTSFLRISSQIIVYLPFHQ